MTFQFIVSLHHASGDGALLWIVPVRFALYHAIAVTLSPVVHVRYAEIGSAGCNETPVVWFAGLGFVIVKSECALTVTLRATNEANTSIKIILMLLVLFFSDTTKT